MKKCFIFCALKSDIKGFNPTDDDLIIAADAGVDRLFEIGVTPHLCVGDFDSAKEIPKSLPVLRHPVRKDDTDLMLAVKIGLQRGFKSFVIFGALGRRLDQTAATFQTAAFILNEGAFAVFSGNGECFTAVKNGAIKFKKKKSGYISVFSYSEKAEGVTEKGLSYCIENAVLTNTFPIGVSNEFINEEALIEVKKGTLAVIWQGEPGDITENTYEL